MRILGLTFLAAGAVILAGVLLNWKWFMNSRKVQQMSRLMGPKMVKIFYVIVGLFLLMLGVAFTFGRHIPQ